MKIRTISCTQFAGIRNKSLSFADGINLIYGKNESGKSTLVNLLSRTLFQNARIDGRSDKEFKDLYFPGACKGDGITGDFADGEIVLETGNGTYTLKKEWGKDARCTLFSPDGALRDQAKIDAVLKKVLLYGEGVYSDMLFSSQRNTAISLQTILDASKKTDAKQEITDAVSLAFSESGGITADAIEQAINGKIGEIAGKHWDIDRSAPVRKVGRWTNGLGEILKAYYDKVDAEAVLKTVRGLKEEASSANEDYTKKDSEALAAEDDFNRFSSFAGQLLLQLERRNTIACLEKEANKIDEALSEWPRLTENLKKAKALKTEKEQRELLDKYESAEKLVGEIEVLRGEVDGLVCPTDREIADVEAAQKKITSLENKLCGMNLDAAVKMLGDNTVSIVSLRTGQALAVDETPVSITEAVKITVPGVMEMQLSPADVNVLETETAVAGQKKLIGDIFSRCEVESFDALEQQAKKISDNEAKIKTLSERLDMVLGTSEYAGLKAAVAAVVGEVRSKESIDGSILAFCGSSDIARYITAAETIVTRYAADYGSVDSLKAMASSNKTKLKATREQYNSVSDIPAEYADISNPEGHLAALKEKLASRQNACKEALEAKIAATEKLRNYKDGEKFSDDPEQYADNAERVFYEKKTLLNHWIHIAEVFARQKQDVQNNPMRDISDSFARYLGMISDGKISSEFPNPEKLNMNIYSGNNLVDYGKLSEGTKGTVSLAFRLAVLDHLFPDGGGVIVFDDPLADMDADRTAQSCKLIKECAKRHQVIFLTCKEEYADMLGGNEIRL